MGRKTETIYAVSYLGSRREGFSPAPHATEVLGVAGTRRDHTIRRRPVRIRTVHGQFKKNEGSRFLAPS
jgi:hypothetical protein